MHFATVVKAFISWYYKFIVSLLLVDCLRGLACSPTYSSERLWTGRGGNGLKSVGTPPRFHLTKQKQPTKANFVVLGWTCGLRKPTGRWKARIMSQTGIGKIGMRRGLNPPSPTHFINYILNRNRLLPSARIAQDTRKNGLRGGSIPSLPQNRRYYA